MRRVSWFGVIVAVYVLASVTWGADWPQYRYDAGRTAATEQALPAELHLLWTRQLPKPQPAFPGENRLRFDATYEPVVMDKTIFVPSMVTDSVTALDTRTGEQRWQFFAEGPVRLAPVAWQGRVFFVSDDGYLYCVGAADGRLLWKFRGLPAGCRDRKLMGNGRLISAFAARGGPVLADGIIYFAAGLWADEGVFVHALDARTGQVIWSNTTSGRIAKANADHGVGAVGGSAGISPQGHLAIVNHTLIVPCGAQLPALFNLKTGRIYSYTMGWGGKFQQPKGCSFVCGIGRYLMHGGDLYDISNIGTEPSLNGPDQPFDLRRMIYPGGLTRLQVDRTNLKREGLGDFRKPVMTPQVMYDQQDGIVAYDLTRPSVRHHPATENNSAGQQKGKRFTDSTTVVFPQLWKLADQAKVHIKAGRRLYCGRPGVVEAVEIPRPGQSPRIGWRAEVQGTPYRLLAADGKLFVVTGQGCIYAFGSDEPAHALTYALPTPAQPAPGPLTARVAAILEATEINDGYILLVDLEEAALAEELVRQSNCDVIAFQEDADRAIELRRQFQKAGLYGLRITVLVGDPALLNLPPYLATLIVPASPQAIARVNDPAYARYLFRCLRPYGGTLCVPTGTAEQQSLSAFISSGYFPGGTLCRRDGLTLLTRRGPLADAADWSQAGANAADTGASLDRRVKPPLTRLWFDGTYRWPKIPAATEVRIAGGRMLVKADKLYAMDVYTGRHLWQVDTLSRGEKLLALGDDIYLAGGRGCVRLDPATGRSIGETAFPAEGRGYWSSIRLSPSLLVAASGETLACIDRKTNRTLWTYVSEKKVCSIALGVDKIFCADAVNRRRVAVKPGQPEGRTMAFDARSGRQQWAIDATGDLQYGATHDVLVIGHQIPRSAVDNPLFNSKYPMKRFTAYRGSDGKPLWRNIEGTHAFIINDQLVVYQTQQTPKHALVTVYDLLTGKPRGEPLHWYQRGCTVLRAGANLLTTRYLGHAAYYDLATGRMTWISNVRAACSNNLFPADGVLAAPNLTAGCNCNYLPVSQGFAPSSAWE